MGSRLTTQKEGSWSTHNTAATSECAADAGGRWGRVHGAGRPAVCHGLSVLPLSSRFRVSWPISGVLSREPDSVVSVCLSSGPGWVARPSAHRPHHNPSRSRITARPSHASHGGSSWFMFFSSATADQAWGSFHRASTGLAIRSWGLVVMSGWVQETESHRTSTRQSCQPIGERTRVPGISENPYARFVGGETALPEQRPREAKTPLI